MYRERRTARSRGRGDHIELEQHAEEILGEPAIRLCLLLGRGYRRTRRAAASQGGRPSTADDKGKDATRSSPLPIYTARGGLAASPGWWRIIAGRTPEPTDMGVAKCVCRCRPDGSRVDAEPMVGLAVQLRAPGAEVPV